jgi:hypothetical protein
MKNPAPYIRKAVYSILNGTVSYNSEVIPVYEGEGEVLSNQIIIGSYSHRDNSNKHVFSYQSTQTIEIITIKEGLNPSKDSDAIAEIVMNLIKPSTRIAENLSSADFQVMIIGGPDMDAIREESANNQKVMRRLLRFNLLVTER